ncbi:MAG: lytic transglycosylase domain-containing protein [Synechococcaceae cyanobacterium]|nr:lytic transglycosylase domain-containing protein [Synechococcaceae cyanobacterium]
MPRLSPLLALSCLGTLGVLIAGRALLERLQPLNPDLSSASLERTRRWSPDAWRRREASLLLHARSHDTSERSRLLRGQGWGSDPLAAVALKQAALAAESRGLDADARGLWQQLWRRFPTAPASADALYSLGRQQPGLRRELRRRFPAHPAALAAALEAGPDRRERLEGSLHLARWGPRWPGAAQRLAEDCRQGGPGLTPAERLQLAGGLARVAAGSAALDCLGGGGASLPAQLARLQPRDQLALGKALLQGETAQRPLATAALLQLARRQPAAPEAEEAVRLLADQSDPAVAAELRRLPAPWGDSAPVAAQALRPAAGAEAAASLSPGQRREALALLRRWPADPASWDLQWELARFDLLAGRWVEAEELLQALPPTRLPPLLAARQRFWLGYAQERLGRSAAARQTWQELLRHHPGGYYGWRAAKRLGIEDLQLKGPATVPADGAGSGWQPLASGDAELDRLWRLDQRSEAWETWRHRRGQRPPQRSEELLVEGLLRQGVGDDWLGLAQLDQAGLRLPADRCDLSAALEQAQHPRRFLPIFEQHSREQGVPLPLLLGLAKQESRFTPGVSSGVGAVGLMQLMPDTAAELAGTRLSSASLQDPARNVALGSRYLRGVLEQWRGDPFAAVASYNAGPGAVAGWVSPRLQREPELWVEAIPYPETRLYVKKVLGNAWSYQQPRRPGC